MAHFPQPLTESNFDQVWEYVSERYRKAKRSFAVGSTVLRLFHLTFFLSAMTLSTGAMIEDVPAASAYAKSLPLLPQAWDWLHRWMLTLERTPEQLQKLSWLLLVLVPLAVCIPAALAIRLVYHPKRPAAPTGSRQERAGTLLETARQARVYTQKAKHNGPMFYAGIYGLSSFAFLAYVLFGWGYHGIELVETDFVSGSVVGFKLIGLFLAYGVVSSLAGLLVLPLYYCRFPKKAMAALEQYCAGASDAEDEPEQPAEEAYLSPNKDIYSAIKQEDIE